jgi:predicted MFS family arabinose efflux permease
VPFRLPRRVLADLTPLRRSVDFRWLFSGQLVSVTGSQLTVVAVPFQVFQLTHSSFVVGLVSLAQLFPLIGCSLIGGAFADAHDRRRILILVNLLAAATSAGLALNSATGRPALWPLFVLSATLAGLSGFSQPAYNAAIPNVVAAEDLTSAYALAQLLMQVGLVAGPALAGVLLAGAGASTVYGCDAATFVVCAAACLGVRALPPAGGGRRPGLRSIAEGFRYLRGRQAIQGVYLLDINAMVFGMPRALFPALGTGTFHGGASTVGALYAAPGAGALVGAITSGWVGAVRRQGRAVVIAVIVWGAAVAAFGLTSILPVALALLAIAGWADVVSAVFRSTILQSLVPDRLRGRLSAVQMAVVAGGPRVGDLEAGGVATALGDQFSVVSGGLACIVGALALGAALPGFRQQRRELAPSPAAGAG